MSTAFQMTMLRQGGAHDLGTVSTIMQEAFEPRFGEAWTQSQCLGMFSLPGVWLTLAEYGGRTAGFALARVALDDAELLLLATAPRQRGRGVGTALLRSVIAEAQQRGATTLHLEVRAGNEAVQLYRREGFRQIGERRDYYRGRNGLLFDALTFSRSIE